MLLTEITDDLTGAADSGSYFTNRGQPLKICTNGNCALQREGHEALSINLSSRNIKGPVARQLHYDLCKRLKDTSDQLIMKKIGTGFRGNDAYELEGMLEAKPDYFSFMIDNAPDLGTFTLYGNQYCEGEILPKSLYANDPIFPPTMSYIPDILARDTKIPIGLVDIDAVKGGDLLKRTKEITASGCRIVVFDAITRQDTLRILRTLQPAFPNVFWTGSLGIADGLGEYLFGPSRAAELHPRPIKCLCFCASAYAMSKRQIEASVKNGLQVVEMDIDAIIDQNSDWLGRITERVLQANERGNVMLVPHVKKYSYKPGTSRKIMDCICQCAPYLCGRSTFDRLVVIGGETAQAVFKAAGVNYLRLEGSLEPAVAQGKILDGILAGKEFAVKGGSVGSIDALEKMLCKWDPSKEEERS